LNPENQEVKQGQNDSRLIHHSPQIAANQICQGVLDDHAPLCINVAHVGYFMPSVIDFEMRTSFLLITFIQRWVKEEIIALK